MPQIVEGLLKQGRIVILCTNALLLEKRMDAYKPHPRFIWDIHLDGDQAQHDWAVSQEGVYDRAVAALKKVRAAENAWNSRDPDRVSLAYTIDSAWRNRTQFIKGRDQIRVFLRQKWERELDYRLAKDLWTFGGNRWSNYIKFGCSKSSK